MNRFVVPIALAAALAACASADVQASKSTVDQFHAALNAGDWAAIDGLLSQSARDLRPGGATARAFRAITQRHGRYLGGDLANIEYADGRTTLVWTARFENDSATEFFVLVDEGGALKIDSYSDKAGS